MPALVAALVAALVPAASGQGRIDRVDDVERRLLEATHRVADELLAPQAAAVDAATVPSGHLAALAGAGVFGLHAPRSAGGAAASPAVVREVEETLAGADLATWFVQVQHHGPVRAQAAAGGFEPLLAELAAGRQVAGIALAHLRRWPDRPVRAEPDGDGWRLDGVAPWYTGWGLNDVALVGALTTGGDVVLLLVPARPAPGVTASGPMRTAALAAAVTVTLGFESYRAEPADVVSVQPVATWSAADRNVTVNVQPAALGLAASAVGLLAEHRAGRREPEAEALAGRLGERLVAVRAEAYALLDHVPPGEEHARRLELRAEAHRLLVEATTGLVVAGAGGSMAAGAPAQRKAREALFLLVQAQTATSRRATLNAWSPRVQP